MSNTSERLCGVSKANAFACTRAASGKDFKDTPNNRRIFFGWATVDTNPQTLARVVTYHPQLKQLVFSPAPEYEKLHGQTISHVGELKTDCYSHLPCCISLVPAFSCDPLLRFCFLRNDTT